MQKYNKTHIICPACKGDLETFQDTLQCSGCALSYRIVAGIPVLLEQAFSDHLEHQIRYFENEKITSVEDYTLAPWQKSYVKRFLDNFPEVKDKVVLDAGAGSGYMTIELAKLGARVISTDLTLNSLIRLKKIVQEMGLESRIDFICCDVQKLPFRDGIFDFYISNAVLEHLPNDLEAISEANRVCRSDHAGALVAVPLDLKYVHKFLIPLNMYHDRNIGHLRRYDEVVLKKKFSGWKIKSVYFTGHFNKVVKTVLNRLANFFDEEEIEREDNALSSKKQDASNIIIAFERDRQ